MYPMQPTTGSSMMRPPMQQVGGGMNPPQGALSNAQQATSSQVFLAPAPTTNPPCAACSPGNWCTRCPYPYTQINPIAQQQVNQGLGYPQPGHGIPVHTQQYQQQHLQQLPYQQHMNRMYPNGTMQAQLQTTVPNQNQSSIKRKITEPTAQTTSAATNVLQPSGPTGPGQNIQGQSGPNMITVRAPQPQQSQLNSASSSYPSGTGLRPGQSMGHFYGPGTIYQQLTAGPQPSALHLQRIQQLSQGPQLTNQGPSIQQQNGPKVHPGVSRSANQASSQVGPAPAITVQKDLVKNTAPQSTSSTTTKATATVSKIHETLTYKHVRVFIHCVRWKKLLWNPSSKSYKNKEKKTAAFKKIEAKLEEKGYPKVDLPQLWEELQVEYFAEAASERLHGYAEYEGDELYLDVMDFMEDMDPVKYEKIIKKTKAKLIDESSEQSTAGETKKSICAYCMKTWTTLWRTTSNEEIVCNACGIYEETCEKERLACRNKAQKATSVLEELLSGNLAKTGRKLPKKKSIKPGMPKRNSSAPFKKAVVSSAPAPVAVIETAPATTMDLEEQPTSQAPPELIAVPENNPTCQDLLFKLNDIAKSVEELYRAIAVKNTEETEHTDQAEQEIDAEQENTNDSSPESKEVLSESSSDELSSDDDESETDNESESSSDWTDAMDDSEDEEESESEETD